MYCPHCGAKNSESDARFCRGCGEDLRLVSQAVMKRRMSWPMYLASRIDDFMASRQQREPWDTGILFLCYGVLSIVAGVMNIYRREFDWFSAVLFMSSVLALWIGVRNLWIYLRRRSGEYHPVDTSNSSDLTVLKLESPDRVTARKLTGGIPTAEALQEAPPSVTETTTRALEAPVEKVTGRS